MAKEMKLVVVKSNDGSVSRYLHVTHKLKVKQTALALRFHPASL